MKFNINNYSDVDIQSTTIEKDITLSKDSQSLIFQMFSKNIYSNPIGSVVREITSNCFDSHIEAKVNAPVIIRKTIDNQTNGISISFIDYGVGMSPSRISDVFSVMFSSTKRDDNEQIGAFGLGSKVPLAYKRLTGLGEGEYDNTYYLITNYNSTKYVYQIYEGNNSPKISLLHSEPTKDGNGTEVRIPVLPKDLAAFKKEMVRQLYYFENIIFEGFDENETNDKILSNEYQIVRAKTFLFRGEKYSNYAHVCLGRVAYPIDFSAIGLNQSDFAFPIALRLNVGEINVTVSRESLDYSENTIKVLKKKLLEAKDEIMSLLAKQYTDIVTLADYFEAKNEFGVLEMPNGETIRVPDVKMRDFDFTSFKYNFMKMPDDKGLYKFFFENRLYGKKFNKRGNSNSKSFTGSYEEIKGATNIYHFEGKFERKIIKQAWLKTQHERYYTVTKKNIVDKWLKGDIADLFKVDDAIINVDGTPTDYALSLVQLQDEYFEIIKKYADDYNTIEVPEDFKIARKSSGITKEMRDTTIPIKFGDSSRNYRIKLDALFNLKCPIFYATKDDERLLDESAMLFKFLFDDNMVLSSYNEYRNKFGDQKKQIMFIRVAQGNIKYMEYCFNAKPVSEFKYRYIHRKTDKIIEHFQSANFVSKYYEIKNIYRDKSFAKLSQDWAKKIAVVNKYIGKANTHNSWDNNRALLAKYYPINNIKTTREQNKYIKIIDEVLELQAMNEDVLQHINIPYGHLEYANDSLLGILKKVMVY